MQTQICAKFSKKNKQICLLNATVVKMAIIFSFFRHNLIKFTFNVLWHFQRKYNPLPEGVAEGKARGN